jgi:GT2 family glycosyltransferase
LNAGVRAARGSIVLYALAHGTLAPNFVTRAVEALRRTGADVVGPRIETTGEGRTGRAIAAALSSPFGVGRALFRYSEREQDADTVAFACYRRDVFDRVGFFDESLVGDEDSEFHFRVREAGGRIVLVPDLRATYYSRGSLPALARQYLAFGAAKAETLRRKPARLRPWHLAPALLTATLALGATRGVLTGDGGRSWRLAALGYAVGNALATAAVVRTRGRDVLPVLPAAFATLHLAYGAGSWLGALGIWRPRPAAAG